MEQHTNVRHYLISYLFYQKNSSPPALNFGNGVMTLYGVKKLGTQALNSFLEDVVKTCKERDGIEVHSPIVMAVSPLEE